MDGGALSKPFSSNTGLRPEELACLHFNIVLKRTVRESGFLELEDTFLINRAIIDQSTLTVKEAFVRIEEAASEFGSTGQRIR